jgi:hypothetical protein
MNNSEKMVRIERSTFAEPDSLQYVLTCVHQPNEINPFRKVGHIEPVGLTGIIFSQLAADHCVNADFGYQSRITELEI